mgnify:CR=1 FL=1
MQDVEKTEIQSQTSPKRRRRRNRMRPLYGLLVAALVIVMPRSRSCAIQSMVAVPSWVSPIL